MHSDFDDEMRRRFAAAEPVKADEAFVLRVGDAMRRRRRQERVLAVLGVTVLVLGIGLAAPRLAPLFELAQRAGGAIATVAGSAPDSPVAAAVLGGLLIAGATVGWSLRRL